MRNHPQFQRELAEATRVEQQAKHRLEQTGVLSLLTKARLGAS
jgi:hypothetical protein